MKHTLLLTHSHIANQKRHPDWMFIKKQFTSVENPIRTIFQWEAAYGMISLYSFKHKDRDGVHDLILIATEKRKEICPDYYESEILTTLHRNNCGAHQNK